MGLPVRLPSEAEAIVDVYLVRAGGNSTAALRLVIRDALADLCETERGVGAKRRLVSHRFAGGREPAHEALAGAPILDD